MVIEKIILGLSLFLILILYGQFILQPLSGQESKNYLTYENPTLDLKIDYPSDWMINDNPGYPGVSVVAKQKNLSSLHFDIMVINSSDLRKYPFPSHYKLTDTTRSVQRINEAQLVGNDANETDYHFLDGDNFLYKVTTIKGDKNYTFLSGGSLHQLVSNPNLFVSINNSINTLSSPVSDFREYEDTNLGIRISYPYYWLVEEGMSKKCEDSCYISLGVFDKFQYVGPKHGDIRIESYNSNGYTISQDCKCDSLIEFVRYDYNKTKTSALGDYYSFENDNKTTIGSNYTAWQIEFLVDFPNIEKELVVSTKSNDTIYKIVYSAPLEFFSENLPLVKKVLNSVEFLPLITKIPSFMTANDTEESNLNGSNNS